MSNQQYNMRLKIVAQAAGVDKQIASHWLRRSAGMFYLNAGMPIEVVSKILGHSNIRTTQKAYAHILDKTVFREFDRLMNAVEELTDKQELVVVAVNHSGIFEF